MTSTFRTAFLIGLLVFMLFPPLAALAAAGDLDVSFDSDGKAATTTGTLGSVARDLVIQPDGAIVTVGTASSGLYGSNSDFSILRYLPTGALDTSFDGDGRVLVDFALASDSAYAVALQPDGKIVVAGFSRISARTKFAVIRLHPNGSLDTSFDGDGRVTVQPSSSDAEAHDLLLQPDGKIVLAGWGYQANYDVAVARLNSDGTLDASFSGDGMLLTNVLNGSDFGRSVILQPDGHILVAGDGNYTIGNRFLVIRYASDGSLDTSFDGDGVKQDILRLGSSIHEINDIDLQPDGKIVIAGRTIGTNVSEFAVARLTVSGGFDSTFGSGGVALIDFPAHGNDHATDLVIQSDGKLVVVGYVQGSVSTYQDFGVARLLDDGTPDNSFGNAGRVITDYQNAQDTAFAVTIDGAGKIVVAGQFVIPTAGVTGVARYESIAP